MSAGLSSFVDDAEKFIGEFESGIASAPLQLYNSALLFSPEASIIKRLFWKGLPGWIDMIVDNWTPSFSALEGRPSPISVVVFSPGRRLLASASEDNTIRIWDSATGVLRSTLKGHSGSIKTIVFSPNGQLLASASWDKTVRLWDSATGTLRGTLEGHLDCISAVVFSPNGQLLASVSWDIIFRLWDSDTGASRGTLEGHSGRITAVVFSPDGQLLASTSLEKTVRLWDTVTRTSQCTLEGHLGYISAVVFSPDSQLLVSISHDKIIRLWDPATGTSRGILNGYSDFIQAVVFSPDGQFLASASGDNTVQLWDIEAKILIQQIEREHSGRLSFTTDGPQLLDERLRMISSSSRSIPLNVKGSAVISPFINIKEEWIRYNDYNVLWLPFNRRLGVYAVRNRTLVLGSNYGGVIFFQFSSTVDLPVPEK